MWVLVSLGGFCWSAVAKLSSLCQRDIVGIFGTTRRPASAPEGLVCPDSEHLPLDFVSTTGQ